MSIRRWVNRVVSSFRRPWLDDRLNEEIELHLEMATNENIARGMARDEARYAALRSFGGIIQTREAYRDTAGWPNLDALWQDVRYAVRVLWRNQGYSLPALLTLALGIGANIAIFSLVYGVLVRPLPYSNPEQIVRLSEVNVGATAAARDAVITNLTFEAWRRDARAVEALAAYGERAYMVTGAGDAERVTGAAVSPQLFRILNVTPAAGRFFDDAEAAEGADTGVVLGHAYWSQNFGGRAEVIGQTLTLDGRPRVIVGVAPRGFAFPDRDRQMYTPFVVPRTQNDAGVPQVRVFPAIARLASDTTPEQAAAEGTAVLRGLGPRPVAADLLFGQGGTPTVLARGMVEEVTTRVRPILLLLGIGVVLVLIVSCANVANLSLFRAVVRQRELALRGALGASRGRLVQQLVTESLLIAGLGGILGTVLAWRVIAMWPALVPRGFPRLEEVRLDWTVLAFAVAATVVAGVLAGIAPAIQRPPKNFLVGLRERSGASSGPTSTAVRRALLVIETAFAVLLLVGSALLVRSFIHLTATDPGYDATQVVLARVSPPGGPSASARWERLASGILERVRGIAGVESAGASTMAPLGDSTFMVGFRLQRDQPDKIARALGYIVTPGYAETLRLRLRQGRLLSTEDVSNPRLAMLVNERFVATYLNDGRPALGRQYTGLLAPNTTAEIVGVVGDVLKGGLLDTPQPEIYAALGNHGLLTMGRDINLVIRTTGDPLAVIASLRPIVRELEPNAPVHNVHLLASELSASVGEPRFATATLAAFSALAVVLAAVGLYGALSYWVTRRRRELGVRMALGADRASLIKIVLMEGLGVTAVGLVIGLMAAAGSGRLIRSLMVGIETPDLASFVIASATIIAIAIAACLVPAWRASAIDPTIALKSE
jgi:putative ABC transport system permease protein